MVTVTPIGAQSPSKEKRMVKKLEKFFTRYEPKGLKLRKPVKMAGYKVDNKKKTLVITIDDSFAAHDLTHEVTTDLYRSVTKAIPKPYRQYAITLKVGDMKLDELITSDNSEMTKGSRLWGNIDYEGKPWVYNASYPANITRGLQNRHLSVWASHGRYYDQTRCTWKWQRPKLFGTTEDLFTPTIVIPYLIPMLEKAGAVVFTPRERDWQRNEVVVDNDDRQPGTTYIEVDGKYDWQPTGRRGFAQHSGSYADGENPFTAGTARIVRTTNKKKNYSLVSYQPRLSKDGRYAVYVSYQTMENSVDDACYTVWHKGQQTDIRVNQRMGGGTWVYLGTFDFDKGCNEYNRVTLTNHSSSRKGVITTDAVRFGGGIGNIERGGTTSGMPRCTEGARYYAQWAGMPYNIYSTKKGKDDYADDINTRSLMTNYLAGGSCFVPSRDGCNIPIELSLAVHSDAGYANDGEGLIGSLAICTTNFNDGRLNAGISRMASRDFANLLLTNITRDMKQKCGAWNRRSLYDRNYSETRLPEMPSAIIETMSHQSFPDMQLGQDPNLRFTLARSIYKSILRYVCGMHGKPYVVSPLAPTNFRIDFISKDEIRLSWKAVDDPQEPSAKPTGYILYTSIGSSGFDNGTYIRSLNSHKVHLEPGVLYSFRVAAVNQGGESFPTEVLCAMYNPSADKSVMIVNGFHRLSSPAVRNNIYEQGFDLDADPGVTLGPTIGWCGRQQVFDRSRMGDESPSGLGWSGDELSGTIIAGNDMDYVRTHAEAIAQSRRYNIVSCSSRTVESGETDLTQYDVVDLLLGLERNDGHGVEFYKSMKTTMRQYLQNYTLHGGALLVSGSYVGTDMQTAEEKAFLANVLKCNGTGSNRLCSETIEGLGTTMQFHHTLNEDHYAATAPDALQSVAPAYAAMRYSDGSYAAVAYGGQDYRSFTMGIPFECIKDAKKRAAIMRGILSFLTK